MSRATFPELTLEVGRRLHLNDVVVVEWTGNYGDGRLYRNVTIGELEDRYHPHGLRPPHPRLHRGRVKEGLTKKEAIRCLKRYIAREVYNHLPRAELAFDSP